MEEDNVLAKVIEELKKDESFHIEYEFEKGGVKYVVVWSKYRGDKFTVSFAIDDINPPNAEVSTVHTGWVGRNSVLRALRVRKVRRVKRASIH